MNDVTFASYTGNGTGWYSVVKKDSGHILRVNCWTAGFVLGVFPTQDAAVFAAELLREPQEVYNRLNAKEG